MRARNYIIGGVCSAVIAAHGASTPGGNDPAVGDDGLDVVPEENLKDMRGGVDLGNLVGYFAIDRVVEVDGQVVAKMQIVVSNLNKLSTGGMPTVTISGPLSALVQVMSGPSGTAGGTSGLPASVVAAAKTLADPHSTEAARGSAGSVGSPAVSSGSAAAAAGISGSSGSAGGAGAAGQPVASTFTVNVGSGTTSVPLTASGASSATGASGSAGVASGGGAAQSQGTVGNAGTSIDKIIPVGNSGQFVVVSNLPNAGTLATAIQNEVRGTTVQIQTTITAQINCLTLLNSAALASALRTQLSLPVGH